MSSIEDTEVLVIGAGPAGLAAARVVAASGHHVLVLDREQEPGGVPRHCFHTGFGLRDLHRVYGGPAYAKQCLSLAVTAGADVRPGWTVTDWSGPTRVIATSTSGRTQVRARAILMATGCRERPRSARLIPGDRPSGVYTTGALQQLVHLAGRRVGRRAVVVGAEHIAFSAVHTLAASGTSVVAVLTEAPGIETFQVLRAATAGLRGIPVRYRQRIEAIHGHGRVTGLTVRDLSTQRERHIDCDTIVFTGDWIPDYELPRAARLVMDPATRGPAVDTAGATSTPGVFAAGNLQHPAESADVAALSGRHVGESIVSWLAVPDRDIWADVPCVDVQVAPPLAWITPQRLRLGQRPARDRFVLRAAQRSGPGSLVVSQGGNVIHRQQVRRLVPNRSLTLPAPWSRNVTDLTPVVVSYSHHQ